MLTVMTVKLMFILAKMSNVIEKVIKGWILKNGDAFDVIIREDIVQMGSLFTHKRAPRSHVAVSAGAAPVHSAYRRIYTTPVDNRPNKGSPTTADPIISHAVTVEPHLGR